jgi:cytochrome c oxidase subunit II
MRLKKRSLFVMRLAVIVLVAVFIGSFSMAQEAKQVIKVTAKKFEYSPSTITVKKGVPVVLELTSLDRIHGFDCPGLGIRSDIDPGKTTTVEFTPQKAGTFPFHCDNFCGAGHEGMKGTIIVTE